jgi:transglutaminase-like putative cysteine protease
MKLESNNIEDYLVSDMIVDWETMNVRRKALDLTCPTSHEIDKACCLYEWVRDEIPHSNDIGADVVTCTASEVLQHGTGDCFSKSHLLAAFLRAVSIPAGFCYQILRLDPPSNNELVLHGLNGIYLSTIDKWIRVDARGNTGAINAQFDVDKEQLAFDTDALSGEFMLATIFTAPVSNVVEKLKRYTRRRDLWLDLPKGI